MDKLVLKVSYSTLKERHKSIRDEQSENNRIRIHRALSWLKRAESEADVDSFFIFLWICFNAIYADDLEQSSERQHLHQFLAKLVAIDQDKKLHKLLFSKFTGSIRTVIDNKYAFEPFWNALRSHDSSGKWEELFRNHKQQATKVILTGDTSTLLSIIFSRIYTLRNQLIHGGATWSSEVNRPQLLDACQILADLVPTIIEIMLEHPNEDFGEIAYPVVGR